MTGTFSVKIKSKKGQFIMKDLTAKTTIAELKAKVSQLTEVKEQQLNILAGYPPRALDLSQNENCISTIGVSSGETLIVEEKPAGEATYCLEDDEALARRLQAEEEEEQLRQVVANATSVEGSNGPSAPIELPSGSSGSFDGILLKKVVPADNSCLFTSIRFVLNGRIDNEGSEMMRHIIAQEVSADPQVYNDAVLGKSNAEYCAWIQKSDSWGGAIEVSILSNYYGIEIDVVDIQNAIINRFGEDKNYGLRVFLLFDGIHYDPLYMETAGGGAPATIFPIEELGVYHQAEQLANEAKSSRQFTNVDKFSLRCLQCDVMLIGQVQAQEHAQSTGHTRFGEI
ncbi:ubiquitin thioesterase OTU1 [Ceratitis capitata]|uniref:Ubiquitin thioesterase OTU n=1 Tax=Ceratitis capitata TaxID=7213 RepID=W8C9W7_CERCA|nr:ubiquitin thioesterase OTU1 [Ceratitis capitata]CAD7004829.1 unnamed protein product [Ceratitis capitata]